MPSIPTNPGSNPMFNFEGHDVRVVMVEDLPWFVAADVCRILNVGWDKANNVYAPSRLLKHLKADEKGSKRIAGYPQAMLVVSESGLYKFVMRSDKPAAKRFQNWVTRDVLPALRKDGMYVMGEEKVKTGEMSLPIIRYWGGLLLVLHEVLADLEALLVLLQHGEVLRHVQGEEVGLGRAASGTFIQE